jgi:hypothetical protein
MKTMSRLAASLVVSALSVLLSAQEHNRPTERIGIALQQPHPPPGDADREEPLGMSTLEMLSMPVFEPRPGVAKLGPFTLRTPQFKGEIIRLSLPVGEYVARVAHGLSAANRRRQTAAARRQVEADLKAFAERHPPQHKNP